MEKKVIERAFKVSGGDLPDGFKVILNGRFDFADTPDDYILKLATSTVVISTQGQLKKADPEVLKELAKKPYNVTVTETTRATSDEKKIAEYVAAGFPEDVATMLVKNPAKAAEKFAQLEK